MDIITSTTGNEPTISEVKGACFDDCATEIMHEKGYISPNARYSFSFNSFIERCSNDKSANRTQDPCEALSLLNFVYI
jgi:hypothetical protein